MFDKVARPVLLVNFLLCAFTLGWFWSFMANVPLTYDLIYDSLDNYPAIDWVIFLVFWAFTIGAGVFTSDFRKGLILAAYNSSAIIFWWFVEMGKFHTLFPDVTNELILGGAVLTGIALVNLLGFIKETGIKWYNSMAVVLAITFFALLPWQQYAIAQASEQSRIGAEVQGHFPRPTDFQLVGTDEYTYPFKIGEGNFLMVGFVYENGIWYYYSPHGEWTVVPFYEEVFEVPMSGDGPELIWMKVWIDAEGVWINQTPPDMFDDFFEQPQGPQL